MRNVVFFNTVKFWGGGEKLHLEYALKFREHGFHVLLGASESSPLAEKGKAAGLPVFAISAGNLSFLNLLKYLKLIRRFRKEQADTVIISGSPDLKLGALAAKMAGVANIVYLRGLAAPVKNTPLNRFLFNRVLTDIVANSEETKRTILMNFKGAVPPENVAVIYHGIELDDYPPCPVVPHDPVILGTAGRLTPQKGQQLLIEVARLLKIKSIKFRLMIAGTGEMQAELEQLIVKYGLHEEVLLCGFVKEMVGFMNSVDIFLLSSVWEGFGYAIVEAMAASKPVVAFDISSNPEIISENHTGYLVAYPDVKAFAEKVEILIADTDLRLQMGKKGRERVTALFQLNDRIEEFISHLASRIPHHVNPGSP